LNLIIYILSMVAVLQCPTDDSTLKSSALSYIRVVNTRHHLSPTTRSNSSLISRYVSPLLLHAIQKHTSLGVPISRSIQVQTAFISTVYCMKCAVNWQVHFTPDARAPCWLCGPIIHIEPLFIVCETTGTRRHGDRARLRLCNWSIGFKRNRASRDRDVIGSSRGIFVFTARGAPWT